MEQNYNLILLKDGRNILVSDEENMLKNETNIKIVKIWED